MRLPFLAAILGILAFLPINFYPAGLLFLTPLFVFFLKENRLWRLTLGVLIFRLIFGLGTIYYTLEPLLWSLSLLIFMGLPLTIWLVKKISVRLSPKFPFLSRAALPLLLPLLWTFFDLLQARWSLLPTYIITAGNSLASSPFLGLAGSGGPKTLTFFAAASSILAAKIILNAKPFCSSLFHKNDTGQTSCSCEKRKAAPFLRYLIILIILFVSAWQLSQYQLHRNSRDYAALSHSFKFATVSVNANLTLDQFNTLKNELTANPADLIVFPENILNQTADQTIFFRDLAQELNTNILATFSTQQKTDNNPISFVKEKDAKKYNSTLLFNSQGRVLTSHNKNRLTFIGEYWPFGSWQPPLSGWLKKKNPQYQDYALYGPQNAFARGARETLSFILNNTTLQFASPICIEIQYPKDLQEYKKDGAQFIVNPTSNRWLNTGTEHFIYLTNNLKKAEAVWLSIPIIFSGVNDQAGLILPNGQTASINAAGSDENYAVFVGKIKF